MMMSFVMSLLLSLARSFVTLATFRENGVDQLPSDDEPNQTPSFPGEKDDKSWMTNNSIEKGKSSEIVGQDELHVYTHPAI